MGGHVIDCWTNHSVFTYLSEFHERHVGLVIAETVLFCVLFVFAIFSNIAMLVVILRAKTPLVSSQLLLVNLGISETVFSLGVPVLVVTLITVDWTLGDVLCKMINYSEFVCGMSFLLSLSVISFDRYRCVQHGGQRRLTRRTTCTVIAIIWVISLGFSVPVAVSQATLVVHVENEAFQACVTNVTSLSFLQTTSAGMESCRTFCHSREFCGVAWPSGFNSIIYLVSITSLFFITPTIFICVFYVKIYIIVQKSSRQVQRHSQKGSAVSSQRPLTAAKTCPPNLCIKLFPKPASNHQIQLARMSLAIVSSFFLMWTPFFIITCVTSVSTDVSSTSLVLTLLLAHGNACVNPLIYSFFNPAFRQQLKLLLHAPCFPWSATCRNEDSSSTGTVSQQHGVKTQETRSTHLESLPGRLESERTADPCGYAEVPPRVRSEESTV